MVSARRSGTLTVFAENLLTSREFAAKKRTNLNNSIAHNLIVVLVSHEPSLAFQPARFH